MGLALIAIAAAGQNSAFLFSDHSLSLCGDGFFGQLGLGNNTNQFKPVKVVSANVVSVALGYAYTLFLKNDGSVWGSGMNSYYQLASTNNTSAITSFIEVMPGGVNAISAGYNHDLFIKTDGSLWGVGRSSAGQITDPRIQRTNIPVQIEPAGTMKIVTPL